MQALKGFSGPNLMLHLKLNLGGLDLVCNLMGLIK